MDSDQTILSEIKAISQAVANLPKINPYSVPAGYFETSISQIMELVQQDLVDDEKQHENKILPLYDKSNVFAKPNEYFNNFSNSLLDKMRSSQSVNDELNEIAPTLIHLRSENPFYVPRGYFASNSLMSSPKKSRFAPIFQMKTLLHYAAAACIIGLTIVYYMQVKVGTSIPRIVNKLDIQQTEVLSIADMSVYLEQMDSIGNDSDTDFSNGDEPNLLVDLDKQTIQEVLQEIPDRGILAFIQEEEFLNEKSIN